MPRGVKSNPLPDDYDGKVKWYDVEIEKQTEIVKKSKARITELNKLKDQLITDNEIVKLKDLISKSGLSVDEWIKQHSNNT